MKIANSLSIFLFLSVLVTSFGAAQTQKLDSIKQLMKTAKDTTLVNLLRLQGDHIRRQNLEEALKLYQQSIEKAQEIGYLRGEIKGLHAIGISHGMAGEYPESLGYMRQSLALATENQMFEEMAFNYGTLGIVYKRIGDYATSQEYYLRVLKLRDSLQLDTDGANRNMAATYINLGNLYDLMDQQDKAIESYEKAIGVAPDRERAAYQQSVLRNLAVMDMENKDYEAALDKLLRSATYLETQEQVDEVNLSTIYSNIGNCYLNLGQWKAADNYLKKALQLAKKLDLKHEISLIFQNLAELRLREKRYPEAIDYSNKNIQSLEGLTGVFNRRKEAHDMAFQIYNSSGNLSKAIYHLNQTMAYKDSLLNETKVREIQNLQVQHEVYLKDQEIKENELQLELLNTRVSLNNKRLAYLGIIAFLLLFSAGLLYFRFRAKKRANALLKNKTELISEQKQVIEDMNLRMEKQMLRAQMNPHFIFNSLNSIQHLINTDNRVSALKYLTKFSKLLRQVLESSINVNLVLREEIELLKIYLELESLRFDNSFSYSIDIDKKLDVDEHEVPMLLVQPYIENAIIHGLMPKDGPKNLSISFNNKKELIECIIEDDGVGLPPKSKKEKITKPSRGMSITAQRIAALEKFSNQELLTIESLKDGPKNGTRVTILIPKHKIEDKQLTRQVV